MVVVNSGTCRLCGATKSFELMQGFATATFGPVVDPGLYITTIEGDAFASTVSGSFTWACVYNNNTFINRSCWDDMRKLEEWNAPVSGRIDGEQGDFRQFAIDTVSGTDGLTISGMLPGSGIHQDFQISQEDIDVFYDDLQGKLDQEYSVGSGTLATTIFRNLLELPVNSGVFYVPWYGDEA